jgi:hypothetical protein
MIALAQPLAALRAELARVDRAITALEELQAAAPAKRPRGRPPKARASEPERAMRAGA